ncbi:MAG: hypothetical protein ACR2PT_13450 [Endozoicomonas sp.]
MDPVDFLQAWLITLLLEVPVCYLVFRKHAPLLRITGSAMAATSMTQPWLWFVLPRWWSYNQLLVFGELLVVVLEALLLMSWLGISFKKTLLTSFSANAVSLGLGSWIVTSL